MPTRVLAADGQRTESEIEGLFGCLAAWASVDVGVGVDVGDGGTELAVFPVRGDDGAVSDNDN